jgi:hypothetical protein
MGIGIHTVHFDRLMGVVRRAFPAPTCYGGDKGGDQHKIRRVMADQSEVERIADAISDLDIRFDVETKAHYGAILAAAKKRDAAERALLETIK